MRVNTKRKKGGVTKKSKENNAPKDNGGPDVDFGMLSYSQDL